VLSRRPDRTCWTAGMSVDGQAPIGILGGTGLYSLLDPAAEVAVATPYGAPSAPVALGELGGRRVAFLPRHGRRHEFPPHALPYRANLWALRSLGVREVLAPSAVGSLRADLEPGTALVPDQVVDRTSGREHTFVGPGAVVSHAGFADPSCPRGRRALVSALARSALPVTDGGTLVVINGPRFSSRAESRWHSGQGWDVVGMTGMPEAALARELALCYSTASIVTDLDAGVEAGSGVTHAEVLRLFAASQDALRGALTEAVRSLADSAAADPGARDRCPCATVWDGTVPPVDLP
jgi:5'-methylthioadenosine phosphorylase